MKEEGGRLSSASGVSGIASLLLYLLDGEGVENEGEVFLWRASEVGLKGGICLRTGFENCLEGFFFKCHFLHYSYLLDGIISWSGNYSATYSHTYREIYTKRIKCRFLFVG